MDKNQDPPPAVQEPAQDNQLKTDEAISKGKLILLVEDDPVLARMYGEKFKNEGFSVAIATDGETGLKKALEEKVSLLLLDIMLPRLSGTDLLTKLRGSAQGKTMPVIVLTNLAEENEKQKVLALGVKEYLIKAMQTPEKVVDIVKKYLV